MQKELERAMDSNFDCPIDFPYYFGVLIKVCFCIWFCLKQWEKNKNKKTPNNNTNKQTNQTTTKAKTKHQKKTQTFVFFLLCVIDFYARFLCLLRIFILVMALNKCISSCRSSLLPEIEDVSLLTVCLLSAQHPVLISFISWVHSKGCNGMDRIKCKRITVRKWYHEYDASHLEMELRQVMQFNFASVHLHDGMVLYYIIIYYFQQVF